MCSDWRLNLQPKPPGQGFSDFSDSSWFHSERLDVSRSYPFCPGCPFVGIELFVIFSSNSLYFCGVSCYFSFLISDFIWVLTLFFLNESGWRFVNLTYLFKETALGFTDILYFCLYIIYLGFNLYYFLPGELSWLLHLSVLKVRWQFIIQHRTLLRDISKYTRTKVWTGLFWTN